MFMFITVAITKLNRKELLLIPRNRGGINSAKYVSYALEDSTYIFFGSIDSKDQEDLFVKDFSRLDEILLMINLGMDRQAIQLALGDYVCPVLIG